MSENWLLVVANGVFWTIVVTVGAFLLGSILAIPLCLARISKLLSVNALAASLIVLLRSVPPIVWLFLIFFGLGSGPFTVGATEASVIALGIVTAANMAEIYRGALSSIHQGQLEAARALNMPMWSRFYDVIAPQLIRVAIPSAATHLIGLMKDTAIASTVGVAEIAFQANFVARREFEGLKVFGFAGLLYILISVPVATFSRYADATLRARTAR